MIVITEFDKSGIYVPFIKRDHVLFARTSDHAPLFGVNVPTPQNAQRFSYVIVLDENGNELYHLEKAEKA